MWLGQPERCSHFNSLGLKGQTGFHLTYQKRPGIDRAFVFTLHYTDRFMFVPATHMHARARTHARTCLQHTCMRAHVHAFAHTCLQHAHTRTHTRATWYLKQTVQNSLVIMSSRKGTEGKKTPCHNWHGLTIIPIHTFQQSESKNGACKFNKLDSKKVNCRYKIQQGSQKWILKEKKNPGETVTVSFDINHTIKANGKETHCKEKI